MQEWQERVCWEQNELLDKIGKLEKFLATPQDVRAEDLQEYLLNKQLLSEQLTHMRAYSGVLAARIKKFNC